MGTQIDFDFLRFGSHGKINVSHRAGYPKKRNKVNSRLTSTHTQFKNSWN